MKKKILSENHGCLDVHVLDIFLFFCASFWLFFDASISNRSNKVLHSTKRNKKLGSYLINNSQLHFTCSKAVNIIISTTEQVFISIIVLKKPY